MNLRPSPIAGAADRSGRGAATRRCGAARVAGGARASPSSRGTALEQAVVARGQARAIARARRGRPASGSPRLATCRRGSTSVSNGQTAQNGTMTSQSSEVSTTRGPPASSRATSSRSVRPSRRDAPAGSRPRERLPAGSTRPPRPGRGGGGSTHPWPRPGSRRPGPRARSGPARRTDRPRRRRSGGPRHHPSRRDGGRAVANSRRPGTFPARPPPGTGPRRLPSARRTSPAAARRSHS